jgi:Family of unknown function (DUF5947)
MGARAGGNWAAKLQRFVTPAPERERCELCGAAIAPEHSHLLEIAKRQLRCACEACVRALGESAGFRRLYPETELLVDFALSDGDWEALQLPIDLVFFYQSTADGGPVALYPGPAGAMTSALSREAWTRLAEANPRLGELSPDVEALLINRTRGSRRYYRVSIDRCYALVGIIRSQWKGLSGGSEVWESIERFFATLDAPPVSDRQRSAVHG